MSFQAQLALEALRETFLRGKLEEVMAAVENAVAAGVSKQDVERAVQLGKAVPSMYRWNISLGFVC